MDASLALLGANQQQRTCILSLTHLPAVVQLPRIFSDRNSGGKIGIDDDDQLVRGLPIEIRKLAAETIGGTSWSKRKHCLSHTLMGRAVALMERQATHWGAA